MGIIGAIGGSFDPVIAPESLQLLSFGAKALLDLSFQKISPGQLCDYRVHVIGIGCDDTGCTVHANMMVWL